MLFLVTLTIFSRSINPTCSLNAVEISPHFESHGYLISRETFEEVWNHLDIFMSCNDGWDYSVRLFRVVYATFSFFDMVDNLPARYDSAL